MRFKLRNKLRVNDSKNEKIETGIKTGGKRISTEAGVSVRTLRHQDREDRKSVAETDIKGDSKSNSNSKRNINFF